jgi:hypothetical protein
MRRELINLVQIAQKSILPGGGDRRIKWLRNGRKIYSVRWVWPNAAAASGDASRP